MRVTEPFNHSMFKFIKKFTKIMLRFFFISTYSKNVKYNEKNITSSVFYFRFHGTMLAFVSLTI